MTRKRSIVILMVEDDEDDMLLMKRALQESDVEYDLRIVNDGLAVMDYLHRRGDFADPATTPRPNLILLDLSMPRKDGRETLAEIKSHPTLHLIPVIIMTSSNNPDDIADCYRLGVNAYIVKPINFEEMVEVMRVLGQYWFDMVQLPTVERREDKP